MNFLSSLHVHYLHYLFSLITRRTQRAHTSAKAAAVTQS